MSKLLSAMNRTARTDNGAVQYESTRSPCLDFFQQAGALRVATAGGEEAIARLWSLAYAQDRDTAIRILQWAYDCRGGAGSRDVMRVVLPRLVNSMDGFGNQKQLQQLLIAIPELGRWDMVSDLLEYDDLPAWLRSFVFRLIKAGLDDEKTAPLVAKWLPRKGKVANRLRGWFKLTRQDYRHMLSKYETVETLKSAGLWEHIKYQNVPSVCMARSRSSFMKHDKERFEAFLQQVAAKHVGIHAGAVMPYDIIRNPDSEQAAQAQWDALPDFMKDYQGSILPLVDVSESMYHRVDGKNLSAMTVAVSLGIYVAQHNNGGFRNEVCGFSGQPAVVKLSGRVLRDVATMKAVQDHCNTNIELCVRTILRQAKEAGLQEQDMPTALLVLSDMQFDYMASYYSGHANGSTCMETLRRLYADAGYKMPTVIYWNLKSDDFNGVPSTLDDKDVMLIGGFSAAVAKTLLAGGDLTKAADPVEVMLRTVYDDRYDLSKYNLEETKNVPQ